MVDIAGLGRNGRPSFGCDIVHRFSGPTSLVLLGAGSSAAVTNGNMPVMCNFFDQLDRAEYPALFEYVSATGDEPARANIEHVLTRLDQISSSPERAISWFGRRHLADLEQTQAELNRYLMHRIRVGSEYYDEDAWPCVLLRSLQQSTTVISMNYDTLAESILSCRSDAVHCGNIRPVTCHHCKMRILLNCACQCGIRNDQFLNSEWHGSIIKIHGSISWCRCTKEGCCNRECIVADYRCRPFEPQRCKHCRTQCSPAVLMPKINKDISRIPELSVMWDAARCAVAQAESILIAGFSMPASDELLVMLMHSAIREARNLQRVAVIDLEPDRVIERFRTCVPRDLNVEFFALPVERGVIPSWLSASIDL